MSHDCWAQIIAASRKPITLPEFLKTMDLVAVFEFKRRHTRCPQYGGEPPGPDIAGS